jgi:hypothetical protein
MCKHSVFIHLVLYLLVCQPNTPVKSRSIRSTYTFTPTKRRYTPHICTNTPPKALNRSFVYDHRRNAPTPRHAGVQAGLEELNLFGCMATGPDLVVCLASTAKKLRILSLAQCPRIDNHDVIGLSRSLGSTLEDLDLRVSCRSQTLISLLQCCSCVVVLSCCSCGVVLVLEQVWWFFSAARVRWCSSAALRW